MTADLFKSLFLPLHPKLFRIAFALTENKRSAEDIVQDTYLKLWTMRKELIELNNPEAFCVTMVKNLAISHLRSSRRHEEIDNANLVKDRGLSPEMQTTLNDEIQSISSIIDKLPEKQRLILRLYGIKECTLEEIGQITGFSPVNIRVLLSRARKFIKEQYNSLNNERYRIKQNN